MKPQPASGPGVVIIYYCGRLMWLEGELTDPELIGQRTVDALRAIRGDGGGPRRDFVGLVDPGTTLH